MTDIVGNDHYRKKRNQRRENQTVNEDHQPGLLQIRKLGTFDFAINLRERFLAAHRQHGMAEADEDGNDPGKVCEVHAIEPSHGIGPELQVFEMGQGGQRGMSERNGVQTPGNQDHHHHGDELHDMQSFFAGLRNSFCVLPPEVNRDGDGKTSGNETDFS